MFTGIIEEMGVLKGVKHGAKSSVLTIAASKVLEGTKLGDSICTNGVCLTVTKLGSGTFDADVMAESIRRTNLGDLRPGDKVNLEQACVSATGLADILSAAMWTVPVRYCLWSGRIMRSG